MIVCPTCSHRNPDGTTVCSACGSPLGGAAGAKTYPLALPAGTKLQKGAFSIGRVLGQGGFGITYKGNDVNLARLVAIKELFPEGAHRQGLLVVPPSNVTSAEWEQTRREFIEEARTVARFAHPGIVNVYSVFEENGTAYQAMEFLDGQSAGALVERGRLNESDAVSMIETVAGALAVMHASGFIHRDLKPDNIVRTKDGRTVLIDFGTAKQFVREKTQKLNPVLTPGYAPLEQYSSQARFDHRLDIYALGATLYHLLTGEVPVSAVERAAGVELLPVRAKNPQVSAAVSNAIEQAMAIKVSDRFDSALDFAKALRSTKQSPSVAPPLPANRNDLPPAPAKPSGASPYLDEIRALHKELQSPPAPPPFARQARLDELERLVQTLSRFGSPSATSCPSCRENAVKTISGSFSGLCPFDSAALSRIEWPTGRCPVCRQGTLGKGTIAPSPFVCGVCRRASVQPVEKPRLLGFVSVTEFECPSCHALYAPVGANAARLRETRTPSPLWNQTRTFAQWNEAAGATGNVFDCSACAARFLEEKSGAWLLAGWNADPFGVGQSAGGQSATPEHWAKIAAGAASDPSTHRCPTCHARWAIDLSAGTLSLTRANAPELDRARGWGFAPLSPYPIKRWLAKAGGKASGEPGRLCGKCRTEFDSKNLDAWALVASPNPMLTAFSTRVLSWLDWHRVGAKLPTSDEEGLAKRELQTLCNARDIERQSHIAQVDTRRRDLNSRLDALYKKSVIEGFVAPDLSSRFAKSSETMAWAGAATSFKYRSRGGQTFWDSDEAGRLVLTSERFWLENRGAPKARTLAEVREVEIQLQGRQPILVLWLISLQKPMGFSLDRPEIEVKIDGLTRKITFDVGDVANMIKARLG